MNTNTNNSKLNSKQGFSLAELLIVVAIIAVLVAISIPIFTAQLEKTRETTCKANKEILRHHIINEYLNENISRDDLKDSLLSEYEELDDALCPSGGEYYIKINGDDIESGFSIRCTLHDDGIEGSNDLEGSLDIISLKNCLNEILSNKDIKTYFKSSSKIDSGANSPRVEIVKPILSANGLNPLNWTLSKISNNTYEFYWTSIDVQKLKPGDKAPYIVYNTSNDSCSVYQCTLQQGNSSYGSYISLKSTDTEIVKDVSYEEALKVYNETIKGN